MDSEQGILLVIRWIVFHLRSVFAGDGAVATKQQLKSLTSLCTRIFNVLYLVVVQSSRLINAYL